ncbi:MAG: biopolymer transporter ExbD [Polyangiaceae bacterium]|nr:biopolymer transporter ExbD [Polyangiaceae bacterium]
MAMGGGSSKGPKNDINVTPLIDVVLVLLIIFMVVTPMLQRGKDVKLPQAEKIDEEKKDTDPLIVSITVDKKVYIEADESSEDTFGEQLKKALGDQNKKILLKGDERLTYGDVRRIMNKMREAGAKNVSVGVEEKK